MFARVTRFQVPPDRLDSFIAGYQNQVVPTLSPLAGYMGAALMVDRVRGAGNAVSYWDNQQSMQASEDATASLRTKAAEEGTQIGERDQFEIIIQERVGPPQANTFVRANDLQGSPAKMDEVVTLMRDRVLPGLRSQKGFRALIMGANRQTGRMFISSVWETAADREASDATVKEQRREAGQILGSETVKVELFESAFVQLKQAARV